MGFDSRQLVRAARAISVATVGSRARRGHDFAQTGWGVAPGERPERLASFSFFSGLLL